MADLIDENEALRNRISVLESELQQVKSKPVNEEPEWYTPTEAAKYIRCKKTFLGRDRAKKKPEIPHSRLGHRTLRYNKVDLDAWIASKRKVAPH
ncbi:MAG: helix-turn-helix domain-containing protein [Desulfuromonadaceae bacterium]